MLSVGQSAQSVNTITEENVRLFAELTGDFNPVHFDKEFAAGTLFKRPIAHGPYTITFITTLFASTLPGPGTVYLSHEIRFCKPVFVGDSLKSVVTITDILANGHIIMKTQSFNQNDEMVIDGTARLKKL